MSVEPGAWFNTGRYFALIAAYRKEECLCLVKGAKLKESNMRHRGPYPSLKVRIMVTGEDVKYAWRTKCMTGTVYHWDCPVICKNRGFQLVEKQAWKHRLFSRLQDIFIEKSVDWLISLLFPRGSFWSLLGTQTLLLICNAVFTVRLHPDLDWKLFVAAIVVWFIFLPD